MKTVLFNLKLLNSTYFLKAGRNSVCSFSKKSCRESLLGFQALKPWDPARKKSLDLLNTKPFCTLVKNSDDVNNVNNVEEKSNENTIIYFGTLSYQVKGVKVFTCISSIGGIAAQPWLLSSFLQGSNMPFNVALLSVVGFFTFVTPFLIHSVTKKYVTEIWYNSTTDTYTATFLSFFLRKIKVDFKIEDVKVPDIMPLFTTMYFKGKPAFVISDSFLEIQHYIKMMKYDQPLDFKQESVK